jgi:hypothetical protein
MNSMSGGALEAQSQTQARISASPFRSTGTPRRAFFQPRRGFCPTTSSPPTIRIRCAGRGYAEACAEQARRRKHGRAGLRILDLVGTVKNTRSAVAFVGEPDGGVAS